VARAGRLAVALLALIAPAAAQNADRPPSVNGPPQEHAGWLRAPYQRRSVNEVDPNNTSRIYDLLRAGNIYLSLPDAIALAIENNLSVQTARYQFAIAATDELRAKGGGTLRGVGAVAFDLPSGVGGPVSPLVTGAATGAPPATSVASNIFNLGFLQATSTSLSPDASLTSVPLPSATGPPIPQYDPSITGSLLWSKQQTPESSSIITGNDLLTSKSLAANLGLQQGFSTGTSYAVTFNTTSQNTNSLRNTYNPYTTGNLGLTVTQPLLRGFGSGMNRRWIRVAKNDEKISDLVFRQDLINLVYGVSLLYYDLASLNEDLRVKRQTLASAQELLKNTQAGVELGTLAAVELTRARAQIAGAEQDVINAQGVLEQQEVLIKNVLTRRGSREPALQSAHLVVTDTLAVPEKEPTTSIQDLIKQAEDLRPDLAAVTLEIKNADIAMEGTKNALLPEVNLIGSVQNQGLAGQPAPASQTGSTNTGTPYSGGYGGVLEQLFSAKYPSWAIGVQLNLPIRNRVAQADLTRDLLQRRAFQTQLIAMQNQAALEIDSAMIALRRARAAYDAAVRTRQLQQESLDVERARYEAGVDTAFFVIQYQAYLSQALSTEVVAKGDYFKAGAGLGRAVGTLLDMNKISIEDVYRGRASR
jgi:outer membrane protein